MAVLLTDRYVARVAPQATQFDVWDRKVPGLGLRVSPSGAKSWTVRYRVGRRLRRWTIGRYDRVSLAEARATATRGLRDVDLGGPDPATAKQERRDAESVGELAREFITTYAQPRKRSWKEDDRLLRVEVLPAWRHRPARDITRRDVRTLLATIAARPAPILANRVRALLHTLFRFALQQDIVTANPVTAVPRPGVERQRDRVLTDDEIGQFWQALDAQPLPMAAAFRLRLITAQRGGEVHDMRWQDVDLADGWWTIPAEHSKNRLPHRVPLSAPALEILTGLRDARPEAAGYVLAGARGKRQLAAAAATLEIADFRGHDLRRTAASRMASAGVPRLVIAKVLNHVDRGVTAVYDRHSYDAEKRQALDTWARALDCILAPEATRGTVRPFRGRRV